MPRLRISIGRLLRWIALIALGLAAWQQATWLWSNLTLYLCFAVLVWACLRARYTSGRDADWWFGFALLGWIHLVGAGSVMTFDQLPSDTLFEYLICGSKDQQAFFGPQEDLLARTAIAHNLFSLVAGWVGGWGVVWCAARIRRRSASTEMAPGDG